MIWLCVPYMTWLSRMCGGGRPRLPWGLDQFLLAAPYLLFFPQIGYWVILGYLGAVISIRTGHGSFFHYSLPLKEGRTVEKVEYIMPKNLPVFWYKALGMFLTGIGVTIATAVALAFQGFYSAGAILALSGALKAVAYLLPKTEYSEFLRGGFLGLGVAISHMLI